MGWSPGLWPAGFWGANLWGEDLWPSGETAVIPLSDERTIRIAAELRFRDIGRENRMARILHEDRFREADE